MATKRITKGDVDQLAAGTILWDAVVKGFGVRRQRSAHAVYILKTRIDGRARWLSIGKHGSPWTVETARKEAKRLLGQIHNGADPAGARDRKRAEPTVGDVLDRYLSEHVAAHNRPSTRAEARRIVEADLKPALGTYKIGALTRADIKRWHAGFADRPYEGNRALAYLRKALSLAHKEWELRGDNPALGMRLFPERKRERFFSDAEMSRIGNALGELERDGEYLEGNIRLARLLALTGMRFGEVANMQWAWIDVEASCVRLPDAKAGGRAVPLGGPALTYLTSLERVGDYVCFGADPSKPISKSTFHKFWRVLKGRAGLENARPHDFRHTVGTYSAATGANAFQVRDILGHKTLSMTSRYVERDISPLRKTADAVATRINLALSGTK